jgi:hypothetical protein
MCISFFFQGFLRIGQAQAAYHQTHAGRLTDIYAKNREHQQ